jgi:hypothetical protein
MRRPPFGDIIVLALAAGLVAACRSSQPAACSPVQGDCGDVAAPPAPMVLGGIGGEAPPVPFTRADVEPRGTVVNTADGFTVNGTLSLRTHDGTLITFLGADAAVQFDESGRLRSISGTVEVPSPHERIAFGEPLRAEVGFFSGRFLNEHRNLGIRLRNDTDYFVFDIEKTMSMSIATGETGRDATKPLVVRNPTGQRTLLIVDYRDPMYYVYGQRDGLGALGTGWSRNGRIPFVPAHQVAGLGVFEGRSTRTGTIPFKKIFSVTGQLVDNSHTELHLSDADPFASTLRAGYQAGFNGALVLDLSLRDVVGLEIPIADASGGILGEGSSEGPFRGHAYARGMTSRDDSWWPAFIPARPITELDARARVESSGSFEVRLGGAYGWDLPGGRQTMEGAFELTDKAMTLAGAIRDGTVDLNLTGVVTARSTTVRIDPPPALIRAIDAAVNARVMAEIRDAETAWNDVQKATADHQFELSLRGVRQSIPGIVDVARQLMTANIAKALKEHEGTLYYGIVKQAVDDAARPYYQRLNALRTAAARQDDARTRAALESALRAVAANRTFRMTYTHRILGAPVYTVNVSQPILTDAQANVLLTAANNVRHIPATSSAMISMRQIYTRVPSRQIFEEVRDDIRDGRLVMREIEELGVVVPHRGRPTFNLYAVIGGRRYEAGAIEALTVAELAAKVTEPMIAALRTN